MPPGEAATAGVALRRVYTCGAQDGSVWQPLTAQSGEYKPCQTQVNVITVGRGCRPCCYGKCRRFARREWC